MPRPPRIDAPGYPQHVVQRGNNRQPVFFTDGDHVAYLRLLCQHADQQHCRVHAYVLMDNHVHLLATPDVSGGLSRMMQAVSRTYVRRVNDRQGRTGTLWEGRFHSTLVDTDRYLLACQRYIELNPVRAGRVARPGDYRWSSYRANAHGRPNALLKPHSAFELIALDLDERRRRYAAFIEEGIPAADVAAIRQALQSQRRLAGSLMGSDPFRGAKGI
ncbi:MULTISPECIES: transposase [unclassified Stenotrophomonas]|uniref:transposase n=1 Tax=unclassified Stenotrophomonas TaxID=196198 RepID=UPI000D1681D3|nr:MULTISPECIES: transposase [unclassified Stenotrophomonas]PTA73523.1 transposase [Stenotrophomonas sp. Nf1]PTA82628.1 transposase [Stenotrophomonas sp. Nf4]